MGEEETDQHHKHDTITQRKQRTRQEEEEELGRTIWSHPENEMLKDARRVEIIEQKSEFPIGM